MVEAEPSSDPIVRVIKNRSSSSSGASPREHPAQQYDKLAHISPATDQESLPVESVVERGVDSRHSALTDLTLDAVAAREGCVQAGDGIWGVQAPNMRLRGPNRE